jgi:hypothetical protein
MTRRREPQPTQISLLDPASDWCQRVRNRRMYYRHVAEAGAAIEPRLYHVDLVSRPEQAAWLAQHHYLSSLPPNKWCFGLSRQDQLVGVAIFGPGMPGVLPGVFPDIDPEEGTQLSRFGLLDDVPAFGETWFLARCFEWLQRDGIAGVVSFSDPVPRRDTTTGQVVFPGHVGTIYQASSAIYTGRSKGRWMLQRVGTSQLMHPRGITKYRQGDRSSAHIERELLASGAPPKEPDEPAAEYLDRVVGSVTRRVWHSGNHRYAFPIGKSRAGRVAIAGLPYPKKLDDATKQEFMTGEP